MHRVAGVEFAGVCILASGVIAVVTTWPFSLAAAGLVIGAAGLLTVVLFGRRWPILLLMIVLTMEGTVSRFSGEPIATSIARELIILTAVMAGLRVASPRLNALYALPLLVVGIAVVNAPDFLRALLSIRFYMIWPVLGVAAQCLVRTRRDADWLLSSVLFLALTSGIVGVIQHLTQYGGSLAAKDDAFAAAYRFSTLGAIGTTAGRPPFGLFMGVGTVVALWVLSSQHTRDRTSRRLAGLALMLCPLACLFSLSRMAWSATTCGVAVVLFASGRLSRRVTALAVGSAIVCAVLLFPDPSARSGFDAALTDTNSTFDRVRVWQEEALPLLASPTHAVLGRGLGSVGGETLLRTSAAKLYAADSSYIRIAIETGALGIVALMLVMRQVVRGARQCDRAVRSLRLGLVVLLGVAALSADIVFFVPAVPLTYLVLGLRSDVLMADHVGVGSHARRISA